MPILCDYVCQEPYLENFYPLSRDLVQQINREGGVGYPSKDDENPSGWPLFG